ncbi:hypothetical protein [Actinokineospora bangkokensis]|uniref:Uncharacterized protein n=1 Tax=Actinokineospora bangkokensis TaxID=1193682 RepID=A0A1Q9LLJ1_9PSEU|nr:hypothetical protein [Actinokineospora bangkokensis]OLR92885.1 hypothetical protein BJP25_18075 [Actinokineospora bangkokensis]
MTVPDLRRTAATLLATEPARVAEATRLALAAATAAAWVAIPHRGARAALAAATLVASALATSKVRAAVTPVATLDGCAVVHDHTP